MVEALSTLPWHPIPKSSTTCKVSLLQAGGLHIPLALTLLPAPNTPSDTPMATRFYAPDYVFLIEHRPTGNQYLFDLGMRPDLHALPPSIVNRVLPTFSPEPKSPAEVLRQCGSPEQQPEKVRAVIFSHAHFDHVGDGAQEGFKAAEMWVGPGCCAYARPGYPEKEDAPVRGDVFPRDGRRRVVEVVLPEGMLEREGDRRAGSVPKARAEGLYEGTEMWEPGEEGWIGIGSFERAVDVWEDGSAYVVDAPGHVGGHQMLLVRVKSREKEDEEDDFVLLAGDTYHHPAVLREPQRTARPPWAQRSMHADPEVAVDTMQRTKAMAERENVWVLGAHDFSVGQAVAPGLREIDGLVVVNEWRERGWKEKAAAVLTG